VALALSNKVAALNLLGRVDEAYATHDALVDKFADAATAVFDDAIRRFDDSVDPEPREQLAGALFGKAALLAELNRWDDSIAVFSDLITKVDDDRFPSVRQVVSNARRAVAQGARDSQRQRLEARPPRVAALLGARAAA
jgi:hypothetical protein